MVDFAKEAHEIAERRNIRFESALKSLLKEQNEKCNAFIRLLRKNNINLYVDDCFKIWVNTNMEDFSF